MCVTRGVRPSGRVHREAAVHVLPVERLLHLETPHRGWEIQNLSIMSAGGAVGENPEVLVAEGHSVSP